MSKISGKNNPMYGKKHSEEALQKMRDAKKGSLNPRYKGGESLLKIRRSLFNEHRAIQ